LLSGGPEAPAVRRAGDLRGPQAHSSVSTEPRCPRCSGSISRAARFRTIVVPHSEGNDDPLSIHVVYCVQCGTSLHMFKAD